MEESMNAKISENKKVSKQVQQIREIEMNIIKETMDRGFLVNQDEAGTCPKFYKNFTNCIQNHMQTDDLASISSKWGFYTERLLKSNCIKSKEE